MRINILGVQIDNVTKKEALKRCWEFLNCGKGHMITTPNPEMVVLAQKDEYFKSIFERAHLCIPDGFGLVLASRFFKTPINEKITGTDFVSKLCGLAEYGNYSVYFLGGKPGVAKKASEKLEERFPNLKIVGAESGGILSEMNDIEKNKMVEIIKEHCPDILFVAFGHPKQEKWIAENLDKLQSVKIAIGIGGAFDFIAGNVKRAPKIMQSLGLEWLWRLTQEPKRYKRIYNATVRFGLMCFSNKLKP